MRQRIINTMFIPMLLIAFLVGAVAGNQHGERYGQVAGRESAENDVLQLHSWTMRALSNDRKVASNAR